MRIISGVWRGHPLADPGRGDAHARLRPTSDRVRESIFNLLMSGHHGDPISGARVLDLFAGTAALGLEALSRGAAHVMFVDSGRAARALILRNLERLRAGAQASVISRDATRLGRCATEPSTLVFLDPPYGRDLGARALAAAVHGGWIADNALVVWEDDAPQDAPQGFREITQRRHGGTWVTILRVAATGAEAPGPTG